MKFPQLPLGSCFRWQGEVYRKTGPMTAHAEAGGAQRLIPRSALVEPLEQTADTALPKETTHDAAAVGKALDALTTRLREYAAKLDDPERSALDQHIDLAVQAFRAALDR